MLSPRIDPLYLNLPPVSEKTNSTEAPLRVTLHLRDTLARHRYAVGLFLLTVVLSFGWFSIDGDLGVNLADEGYLWYGMRAIRAGLVPIRDFHAYDPGRYFWVAASSMLFGEGLLSMRAACVAFQCIGLTCGLLATCRISRDWKFLSLVALILVLWMIPRYKVFEQSVALTAVYVAVRLLERPTLRQHFFSGIFVGLAAFVGRNHGLYNVIAFGIVILMLARGNWRELPRRILVWVAGTGVGYMPQLVMLAFVPGYFRAFLAQLHFDLSVGTNLSVAVPWPWRIPPEFQGIMVLPSFAEGCFYLLLPVFLVLSLVRLARLNRTSLAAHPVFLAAFAVTLPYAHFTFSRPDYVHLAHSVPPLVLGIIALAHTMGERLAVWIRGSVAFLLFIGTVVATALRSGFAQETFMPAGTYRPISVAGQQIYVPAKTAVLLKTSVILATTLAKPDEPVVFLPHWPGLYAATGRISPLHQTYFIRPATESEDQSIIAQLEKRRVNWVMLQDETIDDRDDLRFRNTNPRTFEYFRSKFGRVPLPDLPQDTVVLRRKE